MASHEKSPKDDPKSQLCFVVGPIGKEGSPERKHADLLLNAVIKHVLENEEFGYKVKRADEDADPGMIGDRVITDIINSPLAVADLTDLNPNAFYELGIRHSTELPTIHMAKSGTVLPFDNVAHRTIFVDLGDWHSIQQARDRLADSVRATRASDYKVSNPITQANASFKMRQSEDPRDRTLAAIQERLDSLESRPDRSVELRKVFLENAKDERRISRVKDLAEFGRDYFSQGHGPKEVADKLRDRAELLGMKSVRINFDGRKIFIMDNEEAVSVSLDRARD